MNETQIISNIQDPTTRKQGLNQLVKAQHEAVYWLCRKMVGNHEDANDMTQNTFMKIIKNIDTYEGKAKISTWVYRIAMNTCLDFLKSKKNISTENSKEPFVYQEKTAEEMMQLLMRAIHTLPPQQRAVFNLKYFDELTYKEISKILHLSEGGLKASYHHAVKKIRLYLAMDKI